MGSEDTKMPEVNEGNRPLIPQSRRESLQRYCSRKSGIKSAQEIPSVMPVQKIKADNPMGDPGTAENMYPIGRDTPQHLDCGAEASPSHSILETPSPSKKNQHDLVEQKRKEDQWNRFEYYRDNDHLYQVINYINYYAAFSKTYYKNRDQNRSVAAETIQKTMRFIDPTSAMRKTTFEDKYKQRSEPPADPKQALDQLLKMEISGSAQCDIELEKALKSLRDKVNSSD